MWVGISLKVKHKIHKWCLVLMVRNNNHGVELADIVNLNSIAPVCVCIYIKYLWTWTEPELGVKE